MNSDEMKSRVVWNKSVENVQGLQKLDELLDAIHRDHYQRESVLVSVERSDTGASLAIGLGASTSVLNYIPADGDPPYYTSVGEGVGDDGTMVFNYLGQETELPIKHAIPLHKAREAVRYFCERGELSPEVEWRQD